MKTLSRRLRPFAGVLMLCIIIEVPALLIGLRPSHSGRPQHGCAANCDVCRFQSLTIQSFQP